MTGSATDSGHGTSVAQARGPQWMRGFGKLFAMEIGSWTGTRMWWLQPLIWLVVVAVPLTLLLGGDLILNFAPDLAQALSWLLGRFGSSMVQGQSLPSIVPVLATAAWIVAFTVAAIVRFGREDL